MTLVVAISNNRETVLVADSLCAYQCEGVWYQEPNPYKKIHETINPRFVVGIAGNTNAIDLLEKVKDEQTSDFKEHKLDTFESVVRSTHRLLKTKYIGDTCWGSPIDYLFVGFEGKPRIYLVQCTDQEKVGKVVSDIYPCENYKAIGASRHGALYVLYEALKRKDLTTKQLIAIATYAVYSTAQHEVSVDARLNIAAIRENGVEYLAIPSEGLVALRERVSQVGNLVSSELSVSTVSVSQI